MNLGRHIENKLFNFLAHIIVRVCISILGCDMAKGVKIRGETVT